MGIDGIGNLKPPDEVMASTALELPQPADIPAPVNVIVFAFDESVVAPLILARIKMEFEEEKNVRIWAGRGPVAQQVIDIFAPLVAEREAAAADDDVPTTDP